MLSRRAARAALAAGLALGSLALAYAHWRHRSSTVVVQSDTTYSEALRDAAPSSRDGEKARTPPPSANASSAERIAVFGGEFTVRIEHVDLMPARREQPGAVVDYYDAFAAAATAGDARAAIELASALLRCVGHATTEEALRARVDRLQQTHMTESEGAQRYAPDIEPWVELEHERYALCRDLSDAQLASRYEWAALAAELGSYPGRVRALGNLLDRYWTLERGAAPEDDAGVFASLHALAETRPEPLSAAIGHTQAARANGSVQALYDLYFLYGSGVLAPDNGYSGAANAYAHLRAAAEAWGSSVDFGDRLQRLGDSLSPFEHDWAERRAREILRSANCCKEW
jgi:hypothetical protein